MKTRKKRPIIVKRHLEGIRILTPSRVSPPSCYLIYRVWYDDGSIKYERGKMLYGSAEPCDFRKGADNSRLRPDVYNMMVAAGHLVNELETICAKLDGVEL